MHKRLLLKHKIINFLGIDIFGKFYRKEQWRVHTLYRLHYIGFLEVFKELFFGVFSTRIFYFKYLRLKFFFKFFKYKENLIIKNKKFMRGLVKWRVIYFYEKLKLFFFFYKRMRLLLMSKINYYRCSFFFKYKPITVNTGKVNVEPSFEKIFVELVSVTTAKFNNKDLLLEDDYKFGTLYFNSSYNRVEYARSLFDLKGLVHLYKSERTFYKFKKLFQWDQRKKRKFFTLSLIEVTRVKFKKKKIMSFYYHYISRLWKLRLFYGALSIKQLKAICHTVFRKRGNVLLQFIIVLESRIDTLLYRSGLVTSIFEARQLINHGCIYVNNRLVKKRAFSLKGFDIFSINYKHFKKLRKKTIDRLSYKNLQLAPPLYLEINYSLSMIICLQSLLEVTDVPFFFKFTGADLNYILYYYY